MAVTEAEFFSADAPDRAQRSLRQAAGKVSKLQLGFLRPRLELANAMAAERSGNKELALASYHRAVTAIEQHRDELDQITRLQSTDIVWDTYERLISYQFAHDTETAAFDTIESARARILLSAAKRMHPQSTFAAPQIPSDVVVLYFVVLEDETVRWTFSRSAPAISRIPIGREQLHHQVRRFQRALANASETGHIAYAMALHDQLLANVEWPGSGRVVIVPDGPLHELPFAALKSRTSGRYLVEDRAIVVAPSLSAFQVASGAAETRYSGLDTALILEGRHGPGAGLEPLARLPNVQSEVAAVAASYARSHILSGAGATPEAFLHGVGRFPVVHFAGHALADRRTPELSRLFLQPSSTTPSGWVMMRDLHRASFERTGLVVLGACDTGAGPVLRGEGVLSLARPFLEKGAAGVVYSLWAVNDEASTRLLRRLHAEIGKGSDPEVALQAAQKDMIAKRGPHSAQTWSAFQYAGGVRDSTTAVKGGR